MLQDQASEPVSRWVNLAGRQRMLSQRLVSVMMLVEDGKIRLNDRVATYIPDFGRHGKGDITIRHLLIHMSGLRLCTMAQWEIRRLFQLIRHEVFAVSPFLGSFLAPKCVPLGYCDEMGNRDGHCPIRPHKDEVLAAWADKAAVARAAGRSLPVVDG